MHRVRKARHTEDVQKQVQLPETRFPVSRGTPEKSISLSGMRQGILEARQDEESHENRTRLFHAQGLRDALRVFSSALAGV